MPYRLKITTVCVAFDHCIVQENTAAMRELAFALAVLQENTPNIEVFTPLGAVFRVFLTYSFSVCPLTPLQH